MSEHQFIAGKSYPIDTLPDDLYDDISPSDMWSIRDALFWNDCQGWWHQGIAEYNRLDRHNKAAIFWSPEPDEPMTLKEIRAMRQAAA